MGKSTNSSDDYGRYAAGLFASTVVVTIGAGLCLFMSLAFAPDMFQPLAIIAGGVLGLILMIWLLTATARPVRRAGNSNLLLAQRAKTDGYLESFRRRVRRPEQQRFGTNQPPTADSLKQIKEDSNTWFPSERRADEYRRNLRDERR
jgi:hypothetical protein